MYTHSRTFDTRIRSTKNIWLRLELRVWTPKSQLLLAQSAEGYKFVILRGVEISFNFCLMTTLNRLPFLYSLGLLSVARRHNGNIITTSSQNDAILFSSLQGVSYISVEGSRPTI